MRRILLVLLLALGFYTQAQVYNNEWIDYNKTYYKFKVGKTGLYRISQAVLAGAGLSSVPAEQFQLWRNGQQIPIYTSIPSGPFGASDYIEFWGEMNDGKPDNALYRKPEYQLNDKWSLETDTAAFFLTVNPSGGNFHYQLTTNDVAGNTLAPEPYFMDTEGIYYKGQLNPGYAASVGEYVYSSSYDIGEGWTSADRTPSLAENTTFYGLRPYLTGPSATVRVSVSGNAINPRTIRVKVNGDSLMGQEVDYFDYANLEGSFSINYLTGPSVNFEIADLCNVPTDRMVIHKVELVYPRKFDFGGISNFPFTLPANAAGNYLEIVNFGYAYNGIAPVLYDLTNLKRYDVNIADPNLLKIALESSASDRNLIMVEEDPVNINQVNSLEQRNFVNYSLPAAQGDYIIISHKSLFSSSDGHNYVDEYKAYRSSSQGGGYNAQVYDIDELVDQFGLGIKKHPLSIRNFLRWARANYSLPLKDVLLIGHGLTYPQYRTYESNQYADLENMIPTFGQPASDILLSCTRDNPVPQTPIGRLSCIYGIEVGAYLNKVKEYEAAQVFSSPLFQDKGWMKNVVHVVGSSDEQLGTMLSDYMNKYKGIISDSLFGAKVYTFNKSSTNPVEQLGNSQLPTLFQEGLSLLLYFGHSSSTTLAFNLEDAKNYNNTGKYPLCIMLGCNAGNFFNFTTARISTLSSISENFILTPQRGAIGYFASTHLGIVHYLDIYNTRTYSAISNTMYGKTIGEQIQEAIKQVYNLTTTEDFYARFHTEENTLHGDPAIKVNTQSKPDYVIEDPFVRVLPSFVSVSKTSFNVKAKFVNMGRVVNTKIVIEVKRQYPNSTTEVVYRDTIPGLRYADSLSIDLPIVSTRDKGLNKIIVTIDADNAVDELYETNNTISKDIFIYDDDATPVYPYNYAIINKQNITFAASTADAFAPTLQYKMELDTTELFNSNFKISQTITSKGGLLEFKPSLTYTDSTVYYWRVAVIPATGEPKWSSASFIYLANSDFGFNQSHFYQHTKSLGNRMYIDTTSRIWKYKNILQNLFLHMGTFPTSGAASELALTVSVNGSYNLSGLTAWFQSIVFNVFDPLTFKPWLNKVVRPGVTAGGDMGDGLYQSLAPQNPYQATPRIHNFEFRYTDTSSRRKIMDFMRDVIPDGYYVVVRNFTLDPAAFGPPGYPAAYAADWKADEAIHGAGQSVYQYLKDAGFTGIDSFYRARPFGLVYKKNDPTFTPQWTVGQGVYDNPTLSADCPTPDTLGYITSPLFGPAKAWKQVKWRGSKVPDTVDGDNPTVDVIGVKADSTESVLFSGLDINQQDYDISTINPQDYPFVKLRMRNPDSINLTPYQLRYWRITYDPVPEGAIAPNIYFQMKDTIELGEPIQFKVAFKNVSDANFDSIKVKMIITDRNNVPHTLQVPRQQSLKADSTFNIDYTINTQSLAGLNTLYIDVNPDNDQPEQFHFNNFGFREIYSKPDSLNPYLDVTFDGVHILNHDIVSAKPSILIKLKDEAKWMILDDTSLVTVQLKYPDGTMKQIHFSNDTLKFTPAGQAPNPNNVATVEFLPHLMQDGEYQLIVSGRDKSSNVSGRIQYSVAFQVINKAMISNMLNYPNPFTTSTAFVFTVTGSEVPQNIRIQILTITGKIVREITKQELGPIHVGRNITDFKWDGTDQYGQKLANGIYLYRVLTNLNGKSLEKYKSQDDNTDKYFNKGYGKMYLMR